VNDWLPLLALTAWLYAERIEGWLDHAGSLLHGYLAVALELARSVARVARWA
jgi:hypothetical protein